MVGETLAIQETMFWGIWTVFVAPCTTIAFTEA